MPRIRDIRGAMSAILLCLVLSFSAVAEPVVFTPEEAVVRALAVHPELRMAAHRRLAAEQDALGAEAERLPTASATANYTHTGKLQTMSLGGRSFPVGAEDAVTLTGRIDQVLFTGGRLSAQVARARQADAVELMRLEAVRQSVILRAREAAYEVIRAKALLSAASEATLSAESHRKDAEARVRSGVAAGVEVTRADVRLAEARLNEVSSRNRLDLARSRLATLLGLPTTVEIDVVGDLDPMTLDGIADAEETRALETRPDLQAVRLGARISELGIATAQAGYWPTLSAFGTYSWQDDEQRTNGDESWNVGLAGTWRIFDFGRTSRAVKAAGERAAAAAAEVDAYKDRVRIEVREARLAIEAARSSIRLAEARVLAATEDRRISLLRFREGVGTGTEVIDADRDLSAARASLINARADLAIATLRLWHAMGGTPPR